MGNCLSPVVTQKHYCARNDRSLLAPFVHWPTVEPQSSGTQMSAHRGVIWWSIWPAMVLKTLKNLSQNGKSIRSMWWWERYFRTALLAALLDMWHLNSVSSWEGVRESEYEAGCRLHMYRASRACIVSCYVRCLVAEESPEMQYFWKAPAEGQERSSSAQSCTWAFGSDIFRQGVFVISNETLGRHYVVKFHDPNNHPSSSLIILHHLSSTLLLFFGPEESSVRSLAKVSLASARAT